DLVRYRSDGNVEFLGRMDNQVKVRGFRIELGEIEIVLNSHETINQSAVVVQEQATGTASLMAYIVPRGDARKDEEEAAEQVSKWNLVFESSYRDREKGPDPTFDISLWISSYTGLPIPEQEMREWVDHTVARILALKPA